MLDEDQGLRDALRTELAGRTPPPARGGLAEVVGRGRRRRRTQQLGAMVAAVVAIAGTAVAVNAVVAVPHAPPSAGTATTASPTGADWPRADLPAPTSTGSGAAECRPSNTGGDSNAGAVGPDLRNRMADALRAVVPDATVHEIETRSTSYLADVTDADGTGSVTLAVHTFAGDPLAVADQQAFDSLNCEPPKRRVLADGTVSQIYPPRRYDPVGLSIQDVRIYRPDGELYRVETQNFASGVGSKPDVAVPLRPSRDTLPLTEAQLAELAVALAG
ncbi:hypothetical protein [Actinophytocola sp.]|uniref:hypothetical protein n=1 Tax=Actinophytocola sp. TaxID=1872138 RepID=UPI00389A4E66